MILIVLVVVTLVVVGLASVLPDWLQRRRARRAAPAPEVLCDPFTLLPNRVGFLQQVDRALARAGRQNHRVALMVLDVDRLGLVNNRLGYEWGDMVLRQVGLRLQTVARSGDTLGRLDGDCFALLLEKVDASTPLRVARRVGEAFRAALDLGPHEVEVSLSIGVAISAGAVASSSELLRDACLALDRAKEHGSGRLEVFDSRLGKQAARRLSLEAGMKRALSDGEMVVHYQPEVLLRSGEITGMEVLVRWRHPSQGLLRPDQFIPVAEESGLIVPLGRWVLEEACGFAGRLRARGLVVPGFKLSVNVSMCQLRDDAGLLDHVAGTLAANGLSPDHLVVEVTETARELEPVETPLQRLRTMGVGVAMDDFGTGYSSLSRLRSLPLSALKIDQGFVRGIDDSSNLAIVRAVVGLADALGLTVTAEGIETADQLHTVRATGCRRGQGHYFSKAVPESRLTTLLKSRTLPESRVGAPPPGTATQVCNHASTDSATFEAPLWSSLPT